MRAPKVTEEDLVSLRVGTQEVPRVRGRAAAASSGRSPRRRRAASRPRLPARRRRARPPRPGAAPRCTEPRPPAARGAAEAGPPGRASAAALAPDGSGPSRRPAGRQRTPGAATAADARPVTALFSPPEVALRVGQPGGLALVLVGAKDVQSIEVTLAWDPALAEVTDVAAGSLLTLDGSPVSAERATREPAGRGSASRGRRAPPARGRWWR